MRIKTVYKQKLTKTNKQKKKDKEKKKKGPKINSNYADTSEYNVSRAQLNFSQLRYGIIKHCELEGVQLPDGYIKLDKSWVELLILMLHTIYESDKAKFRDNLLEYEITNSNFCVDKMYGKYSFDSQQYQVYSIYDSGYMLEAIFSCSNIFNAIKGMLDCLEIEYDKILFFVKNPKYCDLELNFDLLDTDDIVANIYNIKDLLTDGTYIVSCEIMTVHTRINSLNMFLVVFCNWVYDTYGLPSVITLPRLDGTGVCLGEPDDNTQYTYIKNSMAVVYTDDNIDDKIDFVKKSMEQLKIGKDQIKFKIKRIRKKTATKEWEVD